MSITVIILVMLSWSYLHTSLHVDTQPSTDFATSRAASISDS